MAISKEKSLFSPFEADETGFNWSKPFMLSLSTEALEKEYKRYDQALADLKKKEPEAADAKKGWKRLVRDYEKLLTFVPRHAEARLSLAYVLQLMGRQQEALDQLNQTVELNPDSAVVWAARASLEREMKQHDAALYDWQQASTLDPQNASYAASHADLLITLERRDEARRVLDAAVRRGIPRGMLQQWYSKLQKK